MKYKSLSSLGYPDYEISEIGEVFGPRGKIRIFRSGNGLYPTVVLSQNRKQKQFRLHVLLALMFIPNPENLPEVNHKDGDKENYALSNLEWVTHKQNITHAVKTGLLTPPKGEIHSCAKLTKEQVQQIRKEYIKGSTTHGSVALGKKYNIHSTMILRIVHNKNWEIYD
jgi:hypothetical protein